MSRNTTPRFDPNAFLATVGDGKIIAAQKQGEVIYRQGDSADFIGYVQSGRVKVGVVSKQGKEAVVGLLGAGEFFGEGCLTGQKLRLATATIQERAVIVQIQKPELLRILQEEPAFAEFFTAHLLERNARVEADLVDQLFNSSEKRLARTLLLLANYGGEGAPTPILGKISQETLAEMIGTTRARVSTFMNKFRKLGLIDYNGHIKVHLSLLNAVLHDKPGLRSHSDRD